jgi:hypothetical protein
MKQKLWIGFFSLWFVLLTGVLDFWIQTPGLKQWIQLQLLLSDRKKQIEEVEGESQYLKLVESQLEGNSVAQEREIRKILGYVDQNEIVFEFEK